MIYQVEIGENDNAYIITGGLTGLTEFNPTIILGDDTAVRINIDSKDDDIFTPWIKQSLEFTLIKSSEGQYDDILAGNDNETWGILIENGYLYLSEGYITISDGGTLKFKGTLALESYAEEYKQTSVVQFTFHDRIGTMEDDIFYTNTQFKSVADILACCLSNVVDSETLYLEWPYTLSSSDDPTEILIDVEEFNEKKKIEVLEDLLHDFGMQLVVDFQAKEGGLNVEGAVVIRSVVNTAHENIVYWNLSLNSYTSSVCGREYFTYTGSKLASKIKTNYLLNSSIYPLINNDAVLSLDRVGSEIKAVNEIVSKSMIYRGKFDFKYAYPLGSGRSLSYYYCPLALLSGNEFTCLDDIAYLLILQTSESDHEDPVCNKNGYAVPFRYTSSPLPASFVYRPLIHNPIIIKEEQFNEDGELEFNIKVSCYNPASYGTGYISVNPVILQKSTNTRKVYDGSSWNTLTSQAQITDNNRTEISPRSTGEANFNFTVDSDGDDVVLMMVLTSHFSTGSSIVASMIVSDMELTTVEETGNIPNTINLTTTLTGDNRKVIDIESKILNVPDIIGSCYLISYLIKDINNIYPLTLDYKSLSQTLLAHLSDQYAWQHNGNRWNLDGACKCFPLTESLNITGQYGLDDKTMIFINGEYDAKRKILKGKWGQVIYIPDPVTPIELSTVNGSPSYDSIISTGGSSIVGWDEVTEYGMAYCLTSGGVYTKQSKGTTLVSNSFSASITGLLENTLYFYKAYIVINGVTYYGDIYSETTLQAVYTLTLDMFGTGGGTVSKSPDLETYEYNSEVIITATPDESSVFVSWHKNSTEALGLGSNPLTITITGDVTYYAKINLSD